MYYSTLSETQYDSSVTVATWPSNQYWVELGVQIGYSAGVLLAQGPAAQAIQEEIQQGFVKADVYYQTLNVRVIEQSEKYTVRTYANWKGSSFRIKASISELFSTRTIIWLRTTYDDI
jgi:hypothetical protein